MNNESIESVTTTAGLVGFIVLFTMSLACWWIFRSMNNTMRRIRYRDEVERAERGQEAAGWKPGMPLQRWYGPERPETDRKRPVAQASAPDAPE